MDTWLIDSLRRHGPERLRRGELSSPFSLHADEGEGRPQHHGGRELAVPPFGSRERDEVGVLLQGVDRTITPHTLRHTCATWLILAEVPLESIASFLGLTIAEMEQTYIEVQPRFSLQAGEALTV